MAEEPQKSSLFTTILAIVGFIIIITIGLWGAVNAVRLSPQLFSTLASPFGGASSTVVEINVPMDAVKPGEPFAIEWEHRPTEGGLYAFSYRCREGFRFETPTATGVPSPIQCETPFSIPIAEDNEGSHALTVIPVSETGSAEVVPFVIVYISDEGVSAAEGASSVSIEEGVLVNNTETNTGENAPTDNGSSNNTGTTGGSSNTGNAGTGSTGGTSRPPSPPAPRPAGPADLSVRILSHGVIDPYSGAFSPQPYIHHGQVAAVRFEVRNIGGRHTGAWSFEAKLPTQVPHTYRSPIQNSMGPGDWTEYTLRFDQIAPYGTFSVHVDPAQVIHEANEGNNFTQQTLLLQ